MDSGETEKASKLVMTASNLSEYRINQNRRHKTDFDYPLRHFEYWTIFADLLVWCFQ